ncbi:MAG: hypothetical protein WAV56_02740 [Microgenomates group bacterium]
MTTQIKKNFLLFLILVLGSALRLYGLSDNPPALFSDEVDIGYQVKSFLATGRDYHGNFLPLKFHSFPDFRTALPIYATTLVSRLPGVTIDSAIRLTPALFSLAAILGIYFLVNQLFLIFNLEEKKQKISSGFWAAILLTLTPWHFTYSRIGFELSMLIAFFIWGLAFYLLFIRQRKTWQLLTAGILLGLTPMIYSTAKLAILFLPLLFLTLPTKSRLKLVSRENIFFLALLFLPLFIIVASGDVAQRFSELAVYTDPTLSPEVNFARQADLGPNLIVGSSPSLVSKLVHNRPLLITIAVIKNIFGPISFDYLFVAGDRNLRHAVSGWGMLLKAMVIPFLIGLYWTFRRPQSDFLKFLIILSILAILPAAMTRDGATHSSRTFLLLLPLLIIMTVGISRLFVSRKVFGFLFLLLLSFEFFLYQHDYWYHYRYTAERSWDAGMKEMILEGLRFPGKTIILSRTYEPPLIFYLYYADFPPAAFHKIIKMGDYLRPISSDINLEGVQFADLPFYFATLRDPQTRDPLRLKNAVYILSRAEAEKVLSNVLPENISVIKLPSGEPLFYRLSQ